MMTLLSFMEKIYSDTKTLSMIYIIGSILLFIFIILLIFSLRKPAKKTTNIIEEPNIDNNDTKVEEIKEETKTEEEVEEVKTEIKEENKEGIKEVKEKSSLEDILNVVEKQDEPKEEEIVEEKKEEIVEEKPSNISAEIPSIDDYVDNIVNKTYEKNEQFSSVYVNTGTIKLEKVLDKLNVDDDIKEEIVPENEKAEKDVEEPTTEIIEEVKKETVVENKLDNLKAALEEKKEQENNTLDKLENLKKSLEEKRNNVSDKQVDLKNKLNALKNNNTNKLDDLKSKLDNLKNQK